MPKRRAITIKDVAEHAGVSQMTVSRVLNLSSSVKSDTRERVQAAINALNYRPNPMARNLARGQSLLIGLLYNNATSASLSELLVSALRTSRQLGHHLVVEDIDEREDGELDGESTATRINFLSLDGLIIPPMAVEHAELIHQMTRLNTRLVVLGEADGVPDVSRVSFDNRGAAREMTRYLISRGHKRIGFVAGPSDCPTSQARQMGYNFALTDHDLPLMPELCVEGDYSLRAGARLADELLDQPDPPTAIFCANDDMATGIMATANRRGLTVPDDLSVVGFGDAEIARVAWPGLTTVRKPVSLMANLAVKLLSNVEIRDDDPAVTALTDNHYQVRQIDIIERQTVADLI